MAKKKKNNEKKIVYGNRYKKNQYTLSFWTKEERDWVRKNRKNMKMNVQDYSHLILNLLKDEIE